MPIQTSGRIAAQTAKQVVLQKLREVDQTDKDPTAPLLAWGLDPAMQGGHLHRDELDTISTTRPIWVISLKLPRICAPRPFGSPSP